MDVGFGLLAGSSASAPCLGLALAAPSAAGPPCCVAWSPGTTRTGPADVDPLSADRGDDCFLKSPLLLCGSRKAEVAASRGLCRFWCALVASASGLAFVGLRLRLHVRYEVGQMSGLVLLELLFVFQVEVALWALHW